MVAFAPQHLARFISQLVVVTSVICLFSQFATAADFYRWVDEKGSTHYTQTPPPKMTKKSVKKITVIDDSPVLSQSNKVENDGNVKKEASNSFSTSTPPESSRANSGDSTAASVSSSSDSVSR